MVTAITYVRCRRPFPKATLRLAAVASQFPFARTCRREPVWPALLKANQALDRGKTTQGAGCRQPTA